MILGSFFLPEPWVEDSYQRTQSEYILSVALRPGEYTPWSFGCKTYEREAP